MESNLQDGPIGPSCFCFAVIRKHCFESTLQTLKQESVQWTVIDFRSFTLFDE